MPDLIPRAHVATLRSVDATPEAVDFVAMNLRESDAQELYASSGRRDLRALLHDSVKWSDDTIVWLDDNAQPVAVQGVGRLSLLCNAGCPWMVGTPAVNTHRRAYISAGRSYTAHMRAHFDILTNYVDCRNRQSVAWLRRLGYQMGEPEPYGPFGLPFYRFQIGE